MCNPALGWPFAGWDPARCSPVLGGDGTLAPVSSSVAHSGPRASLGRRLVLALAAPLLLLLLVEAVLRLMGWGYATSYFVPKAGAPDWLVENPNFGRRFFPPGLLRVPPPTLISRHKAPGAIRILIFGESAAMGDPKPAFGVARYLGVLLKDRYPGVEFEVIPVAMTAINSHALLPMARECAGLGADYWIVFAGNNEMLGPFGAGSALGGGGLPWPVVRLVLAAKATRIGQAIESMAGGFRGQPIGSSRWSGLRVMAGESITGESPQRARVYEAFERNLNDLARAGQASGARVLLGTVAVNLRDCGPFGSVHDPDLAAAELAAWTKDFESGLQALTNGQSAEAQGWLEKAVARSGRHAGVRFVLGQALLAGTNAESKGVSEAFVRARDFDTLPLRADSRLNDIVRRTASATASVLVDAEAALSKEVPGEVPGGESFYEHVHLTPEGNHALARAFAEGLAAEFPEALRKQQTPGDWATPATCATRLALTPWGRGSAAELMLRRCLEAPFTNRLNHDRHIEVLATELSKQRRAQTPEGARFIRGVYTNAVASAPGDHHLVRTYAEFLEGVGDLAGSAEQWKRVVELLPHHPVAYLQSGSMLRRLGRLEEAQPLIERAVAMQSDWIEARLELSELLVARGRPHEAVGVCREALKIQPDHARAYLRLADAQAANKQGELAIASLEEAVRLDPRLWEARYLLGVEYALKEKIEEARQQFAEVVRWKPDHARGQFNLGIALARLQQWEAAAIHLAEAIRLEPRNEAAKQALAQVLGIQRGLQNRTAPGVGSRE